MKKGMNKNCKSCQRSFYLKPSRIERTYCSPNCYYVSLEKPKLPKVCRACNKNYEVIPSSVASKYCSQECSWRAQITEVDKICKVCDKQFAVDLSQSKTRVHCSKKCSNLGLLGDKNVGWAGDRVGYNALHSWVRKTLGVPQKCEFCETTQAKMFDWANVSHLYKRETSDWIRLCRKCHIAYDTEKLSLTL